MRKLPVLDPDLQLAGMDVDVHIFVGQIEGQDQHRKSFGRDNITVGVQDRMGQRLVPDKPPVHVHELIHPVAAGVGGQADETFDPKRAVGGLHFDHVLHGAGAKYSGHPLPPAGCRQQVDHVLLVVNIVKLDLWKYQGE